MSRFSEKLFKGESPTDDEWSEHLIEAHKIAPSMTPEAFAAYKTEKGVTSYELLAQSLTQKSQVALDLACGDGFLIPFLLQKTSGHVIAVDMSEDGLALAKKAVRDPRVTFHRAKAQKLPLKDESVDTILCHLGFMLMKPIEPVVAELTRILKPGGTFAAVITNHDTASGLMIEIQQCVSQFIAQRCPHVKNLTLRDPRIFTHEGLSDLFNSKLGWNALSEWSSFELKVQTNPNGVWNLMKDMYLVGMLSDSDKAQLQRALVTLATKNCDVSGTVSFGFPMRKFVVSKK